MNRLTPILLAGLFSSGAVLAQDVNFDRQDEDRNGYLSQGEWRDIQGVNVRFEKADKDGDQRLSRSEVQSATGKSRSGSQMKSQQISSQGSGSTSGSSQAGMQQASSQSGSQQGSQQKTSGPEMSDAAFQRIDADGDSRISRQEAQQAETDYVSRTFDGIDVNGNGYIEKDEIKADKK